MWLKGVVMNKKRHYLHSYYSEANKGTENKRPNTVTKDVLIALNG